MAAYEVLLLNTAIPQIQAAQSGDTYLVPRDIAFSAALTLSAGTANGVPYLNASKVLTTGSALTFDGTLLTNSGSAGGVRLAVVSTGSSPEVSITSADTGTSQINFGGATTPKKGRMTYSDNSDVFWWSLNNGSEQMRLTSTGLGIGTSSPAVKLTVRSPHAAATATTYTGGFLIHDEPNGIEPHLGAGVAYNGGDQLSWIQSNSSSGVQTLALNPVGGQVRFGNSAMLLDTSGNLGLGVTPSAWGNQYKAVQNGRVSLTYAGNYGWYGLLFNAYSDNTNFQYIAGNSAGEYRFDVIGGSHAWYNAPSGTADGTAATSLTSAQNGNSYTIKVAGTTDFTLIGAANNNVGTVFTKSGGTGAGTGTVSQNISFTQAMTLDASGNLKLGGTANRATTAGTNHLDIFNGTAPVGTLADGISIYSAAGEAYVMDAAGNATLFSPHDAETNEWIFKSKHTPTGKVLKIDVERLLKFVNDHFGLDAVHEFVEE